MKSWKLLPAFVIGSALILLGCSKEAEAPPVPKATIENLKVAHACAFKRAMWYDRAATEADKDRLGNLAKLFRAISRSESIHAALHEQLLASKGETTDTSKSACLPLGTTQQALKMGTSLERAEYEGFYPPMVTAAEREGWTEAAQQFRHTITADSKHFGYIRDAEKRSGTVPRRSYRICTGCGNITTRPDTTCVVCSSTAAETL